MDKKMEKLSKLVGLWLKVVNTYSDDIKVKQYLISVLNIIKEKGNEITITKKGKAPSIRRVMYQLYIESSSIDILYNDKLYMVDDYKVQDYTPSLFLNINNLQYFALKPLISTRYNKLKEKQC